MDRLEDRKTLLTHRNLETLQGIALFGKAAARAVEQFTREISCGKDDLQF